MNSLKKFVFLFFVLINIQAVFAQQEDKSLLTVDLIFNNNYFTGEIAGQTRWIDNGKFYTTLENSKETTGGRDIVKYETETGMREVLVSAKLLIPERNTTPLSISNYSWSPNRNMLMIYTNTVRVWR